MEIQKILTGLLSKAYKLDDGKIGEILNADNATEDSVIKELLEIDTERISKIKPQTPKGETFQDGYAKAKKEVLQEFEANLKKTHNIESDNTGTDLIDEILQLKAAELAKTADIDENKVKSHPTYIAMEKKFKKDLADAEKSADEKYKGLEAQMQKENVFLSVKEAADAALQALNPVLPKNAKAAATIKNQFYNELKGFTYEKQADGSFVIKDAEGNVKSDAHGHNLTLDALVKQTSENYFDFAENNGGQNAGNQNGGQQGGFNGAVPTFNSEAEVMKYATDPNVPEEARSKAISEWNAKNNV